MQRTAARAERLIDALHRHVDPLAHEARQTLEQARRTAAAAEITAVRVSRPLEQAIGTLLRLTAWKDAVDRTVGSQKETVGVLVDATRKVIGGLFGHGRGNRLSRLRGR